MIVMDEKCLRAYWNVRRRGNGNYTSDIPTETTGALHRVSEKTSLFQLLKLHKRTRKVCPQCLRSLWLLDVADSSMNTAMSLGQWYSEQKHGDSKATFCFIFLPIFVRCRQLQGAFEHDTVRSNDNTGEMTISAGMVQSNSRLLWHVHTMIWNGI